MCFNGDRQFGDAPQRHVIKGTRLGLRRRQFHHDIVAVGPALNLECLVADLGIQHF